MLYKRGIAVLLVVMMLLATGCKKGDFKVVWSQEMGGKDLIFQIPNRSPKEIKIM